MTTPLFEERKALLADRLRAIARLAKRLAWSRNRVGFPLDDDALKAMSEQRAESLSAFIQRFAKLQDLVGASFRELAILSGYPADDYHSVLNAMEKWGIVDADGWRALRVLRNEAAHEYNLAPDAQARIFNALEAATTTLIATAQAVMDYCSGKLGIDVNLPR